MTASPDFPLLVSVEWLAAHLGDTDVRVLDASSYLPTDNRDTRAEFEVEHIPGAAFFDLETIVDPTSPLPHTVPSPADFAKAVGGLGISNTDTVIIYDTSPFFSAPRVWWMFTYFGHEKVAVLNGGLPEWKRQGQPTENGPTSSASTTYSATNNKEMLADLEMVWDAVKSGSSQIADARGFARFSAQDPEFRPGIRSGHMPGAKNVPFNTLIGEDGLFLPPEDIAKRFEEAGITPDKPVITTCGSGVTACVLSLGLALTGRPSRVFDGSWTEWGGRTDTPVATGA